MMLIQGTLLPKGGVPLANFLTRFVEAIGTSAIKSMLPEMYFFAEGENAADSPAEEAEAEDGISE